MDPQVVPARHGGGRCRPAAPGGGRGVALTAGLPLVADGLATDLYVDPAEHPAVIRAAGDLQADIERVSGVRPRLLHALPERAGHLVVITTSAAPGRWEASVTRVVDRPFPGVDRALTITGSDRRGTVYGIYDTSERIGVSPWHWWADVPIAHRDTVTVPARTFERREPSVRYRASSSTTSRT
ncbi:hypothetical protein [Streptomyces acidiscabies]|uniref:hypothetical protein n=1 Tax=Streptomyces acidiscabies TaxID=42234 RepID=UPI002FF395BC